MSEERGEKAKKVAKAIGGTALSELLDSLAEPVMEGVKGLIPSVAPAAVSAASLATAAPIAGAAILATWLILSYRRKRGERAVRAESDEEALVELNRRIREVENRIKHLEKALEKAEGRRRRLLEDMLSSEREILEHLYNEYELYQLRVEALRKLNQIAPELAKEVKKFMRKLERGEEVDKEQLRILKALEEKWRQRTLQVSVLQSIVTGGVV